jgi:hypothetical protein
LPGCLINPQEEGVEGKFAGSHSVLSFSFISSYLPLPHLEKITGLKAPMKRSLAWVLL